MSSATIAEVVARLGAIAPFDRAAPWDPVGLQLGDPAAPVHRMAVCHEVTEKVLSRLEDADVSLLVSYHPLLFHATVRLISESSPAGRAFRLIEQGIALAVMHTAFDVVDGGAADALADTFDLRGVRPFGTFDESGSDEGGFIGRWGTLPQAVLLADFAESVTNRLGGTARVSNAGKDPLRTVAVVPGSGSSFVDAAALVADVMVTGDIGHHRARSGLDQGLSIVDPGHAATERPGLTRLYSAVAALGPCLDLTAVDASPWEELS